MWLSHSFCLNYCQQWWHSDFMLYISLHNNVLSGLFLYFSKWPYTEKCIRSLDRSDPDWSQTHDAMREQLAHGLGTEGYSECGDSRLATGHPWGSTGLFLRPCALQNLQKLLGITTWRDTKQVCRWYKTGRSCWLPGRQRGSGERPWQIREMGNHERNEV